MKISIEMNFFDGSSAKFEVTKSRFVIGRSEKADVVVAKEGFSREHCMIEYEDDGFYITDLGSTNGVRINNKELPKKVRTHYDSFLPLSIGFAESVAFEILETSRLASPVINEEISKTATARKKVREDISSTGEFKPSQMNRNKVEQVKKENVGFTIKLILIGIVAAVFVVYFFMTKEGMIDDGVFQTTPSSKSKSGESDYIEF